MLNVTRNSTLDADVVIRRILAVCIDSLILSVIIFFVNSSFGAMHVTGGTIPTNYTAIYTVDWPWYILLVFAYFFILEARFSSTIGKRLLGLHIVDRSGKPITLCAALLRNLLRFLDALPCFYLLGGIIMFLLPQHQRIGDLAAQTLVVRYVPAPARTPPSPPQRLASLASTACLLLLIVCACVAYFLRPVQVIGEMRFTHQAFFDDESMTNFKLGSPSWGFGTVRYPVQYRDQEDGMTFTCQGEIVMNFLPMRGWADTTGTGSGCQAIK
ncbi:RDD family protein [Ktedonobacter racemifer]|uniref:RDD domain containing protein n=1 Tax=Ktedonobacter racemifer DSM 44963 TaxID=485913 RepID=D6TR51_KTERA|nr:RDD family protein [Ktedonobacter racemifer]EFH87750.1 RDD domain containing protein [Ktedonobacter racemifer DSM 44963]